MKPTFHHTLIALAIVDIEKILTQTNFYNMRYKGAILILLRLELKSTFHHTLIALAIVDIEKIWN